ncbi:TrkH family potassium uptake protein [Magnetovibrio blakemorei]|uniref:Trk system potassium uptake protein n=1 Tax=Magnetovibrio blakemorei TaxID=28181 RepID=A0A1E5QB11_9PROT|nr:TrkH family potassium uptake protein [Magnetovibrio blakemorei]OEJ69220.1 potassium transporter TrkH [Magnetovibrio blakemorei]
MMDIRPVMMILGILLATLSVGMCIPALVDAMRGNPDWQVFAVSSGLTLFVGVSLTLTSSTGRIKLNVRQAFVMTALSWLVLTVFAALPFMFSELKLSYTDAFFEAMSGITTTGSTVITGLDGAPPGILLWRGILQWLGGLGIVVMAIAVMPMMGVGGMQMFKVEAFDTGEKVLPRAAQISLALVLIYAALTLIWIVLLWWAGMTPFEAVVHSMTTISTGGYSTSDASVGHFDSWAIDIITTLGMLVGGMPFLLFLQVIRGKPMQLWRDEQVRGYLTIATAIVLVVAALLWFETGMEPATALRYSAFNVVSVMTGTGYTNHDYGLWGTFALPIFFFIMFIGGCAGSTTCGIKIFRFQVLYAAARVQVRHLLQPHGVFIPYYNHRPIPDEVIMSVLTFFFVFALSFAFLALGLGMLGLDFMTAVSSAATAISNVGPGLGPIVGPSGTFQSLPDAAKWMLSAGMLLGRLELFTILVLFSRTFWRG